MLQDSVLELCPRKIVLKLCHFFYRKKHFCGKMVFVYLQVHNDKIIHTVRFGSEIYVFKENKTSNLMIKEEKYYLITQKSHMCVCIISKIISGLLRNAYGYFEYYKQMSCYLSDTFL